MKKQVKTENTIKIGLRTIKTKRIGIQNFINDKATKKELKTHDTTKKIADIERKNGKKVNIDCQQIYI